MNYGTALPPDFIIPRSAFWLRADLERKNPFETVVIPPMAVVMDCGAFIGTFAAASLAQGAKAAICYEASPKNAALLRENALRYGAALTVVEAALTSGDDETVSLTMSGFSGANSILPSPNRPRAITVRAVNFRRELTRLQPQVVKLDVEGAEYGLLASLEAGDLASIECVFIEFHPMPDREARISRVRQYLIDEGFRIVSSRVRAFVALRER